jgi:hypothetical protein
MAAEARRPAGEARAWPLSLAAALAVVGFVVVVQWNSSVPREELASSPQQALAREVAYFEKRAPVWKGR